MLFNAWKVRRGSRLMRLAELRIASTIATKRTQSLLVLALICVIAVSCGGTAAGSTTLTAAATSTSPTSPTSTTPPTAQAPTAPATGPTINVRGAAEAPHELPFTFPVSAQAGSAVSLRTPRGLVAWISSALVAPLKAQAESFSVSIDFGLAQAALPQQISVVWDFGDGKKSQYGCTQTTATALCDSVANALS